jgi:hypothetical protein
MNPAHVDLAEKVVKVAKEVALLSLIVYIAWYIVPFIPKWSARMADLQPTEFNLAGIGFKLAQAEKKIEQAIQPSAPQPTPKDDGAMNSEQSVLAEALESLRSVRAQTMAKQGQVSASPTAPDSGWGTTESAAPPYWVYLGISTDRKLSTKTFKLSEVPSPGQIIEVVTDTYKRGSSPTYKETQGWVLGNTIGVLKTGQLVSVQRIEVIESNQPGSKVLWAAVVNPR